MLHYEKVLKQWEGKEGKDSYDKVKTGQLCKLPLLEELFLTLARLYLGLSELDLANRFDVSKSSVSRITNTWVNVSQFESH